MADTGMVSPDTIKRVLKTRGALVAGVTSVSLALLIIVQNILGTLIYFVSSLPGQVDTGQYSPAPAIVYETAVTTLPFAVGFFLSLWLVGPISEQLRLPHVITRSVLAVGIGVTLVFIVRSVVGTIQTMNVSGSFFSNSFPAVHTDSIPGVLGQALVTALSLFVTFVPLGVLAGIALWEWRKAHPATFHVEGIIDV